MNFDRVLVIPFHLVTTLLRFKSMSVGKSLMPSDCIQIPAVPLFVSSKFRMFFFFSFSIGSELNDFLLVASELVYGTEGIHVLHLPCMDLFSERFDSLEFISCCRYKII